MQLLELKVKHMTLAAESKIIRGQEIQNREDHLKAKYKQRARIAEIKFNNRVNLWQHRVQVVRPEARATHLARAFLMNHTYESTETNPRIASYQYKGGVVVKQEFEALWDRVADLVKKFGDEKEKSVVRKNLTRWRMESNWMQELSKIYPWVAE